jgi:polyisoprenoid-binding protein YceI
MRVLAAVVFCGVLGIGSAGFAQVGPAPGGGGQLPPTTKLKLLPASRLNIEGTSNMHDWSCAATAMGATIEVDTTRAPKLADEPEALRRFEMTVPVGDLRCGNGTMEGKLRDALHSGQHPHIKFQMTEAKGSGDGLELKGTLTVNGVTREITSEAKLDLQQNIGRAEGTVKLKMSDFKVEPPSALLGALKTGDAITIKYNIRVTPSPVALQPEQPAAAR